VGITGSNGKTTVKDMAASILATQFNVLKSHKSFNNHIGLPLTLANMTEQHEAAVVEMGMNAPGELTHLAGIAQPDVGVITNIAQAHFGFFHSLEAIMQAKMELIRTLPAKAVAVLNASDVLFEAMRRQVPCALVTFGVSDSAPSPTVTARNVKIARNATYAFDMTTPDGSVAIKLPLPGEHNVQNALAAAAILYALVQTDAYRPIEQHHKHMSMTAMIKTGLAQFSASPMRMQVVSHHGVTFLNDAYNANPNSMAAALHTLKSIACSGKKIAVLGDMAELGEISASAHYDAGALAADVPVNALFLLGEYAADTSRGAQEAGMTATDIVISESHAALAALLSNTVAPGDIVLIKASRSMALEQVLEEYMTLVKA
jgi:UDP-N-acetylmuramoyl-tripeptide--D-alanyl-D-alanine ligase